MEHSHFNVKIPLKDNKLLIYNSLSLDLALTTEEQYESINGSSLEQFDIRMLDLFQRGFICESADAQYEKMASSDYLYKKENPFIHLTIMMSESCNFSCNYCNQGQDKDKTRLSKDVIESVIKYISNVTAEGSQVDITWFGGEPLLDIDTLIEYSNNIQRHCNQLKVDYTSRVLTNGFLLNAKNATRLWENSIKVAQVSLDGSKEKHDKSRFAKKGVGTYDIIMGNISNVLERLPVDYKISLRVNVSRNNIYELPDLIDDMKKRGLNRHQNFVVYWGHIYDPTTSKIEDAINIDDILVSHEEFANIELIMNRLLVENGFRASHSINETRGNCIATQKNSFVIRPDGELHKCYIPVSNKENACGNIANIEAARESLTYAKWNSWNALDEDNCSNCRLVGSCRGGCPINYISDNFAKGSYKCPPSKLKINEHIFERAVMQGLVRRTEWDDQESNTNIEKLKIISEGDLDL